jgi:nitrogen fixation/metabolism regulation signal transduction histidine kinase
MVETTERGLETRPPEGLTELAHALSAGVLLQRPDGGIGGGDERALELLGCADRSELARCWEEISPLLESATTLQGKGQGTEPLLLPSGPGGRPLLFEIHRLAGGTGGAVLVVRDPEPFAEVSADLRLATFMRALSQVSPAVAHDLRAPINAMVFNIEILKETVAAAKALELPARERQLRYVGVLKDELARLHGGLEHFLSHTTARGDRPDAFDLREAVTELVALLIPQARKSQVKIVPELPEQPVLVAVNRYQLRQAFLEIGLAALAGVARGESLTLHLAAGARTNGDKSGARLVLAGPLAAEPPALDFTLAPGAAPQGSVRLHHARAILNEQGGKVEVTGGSLGQRSFEIELPASGKE